MVTPADVAQMLARTRPGTRGVCPVCQKERISVVGVDLGDGSSAELRACGFCESRSWTRDGVSVPASEVVGTLRETRGPRSTGRRPPPT